MEKLIYPGRAKVPSDGLIGFAPSLAPRMNLMCRKLFTSQLPPPFLFNLMDNNSAVSIPPVDGRQESDGLRIVFSSASPPPSPTLPSCPLQTRHRSVDTPYHYSGLGRRRVKESIALMRRRDEERW